jgi:predicted TIM-barrel fold metal-dependent hydrolase
MPRARDGPDTDGHRPSGPAEFFSDPAGWVPVLERYRSLRLNLAHFGGGSQFPGQGTGGGGFAATIIGMLNGRRYPNLYCDMSYFADTGLEQRLLDVIAAHPVVGERLLFGTDYVMVSLDPQPGGLRSYFDRFLNLPPAVYGANARRFLGLSRETPSDSSAARRREPLT